MVGRNNYCLTKFVRKAPYVENLNCLYWFSRKIQNSDSPFSAFPPRGFDWQIIYSQIMHSSRCGWVYLTPWGVKSTVIGWVLCIGNEITCSSTSAGSWRYSQWKSSLDDEPVCPFPLLPSANTAGCIVCKCVVPSKLFTRIFSPVRWCFYLVYVAVFETKVKQRISFRLLWSPWPRLAGISGRVLRRGKLPGFRASLSSRAHTHQLDPDSFHDGRGLEPLCVWGLVCGFLKDSTVPFSSCLDGQRLLKVQGFTPRSRILV